MGQARSNRGVIWGVVAIVILLAAGGLAFVAKNYYDARYTGATYYARVPVDANIEVQDILDAQGKPVDKGYDYSLTGYDEKGQQLPLDFTVRADTVDGLYQPGTYVRAQANPSIVVFQEPIAESQVPPEVLALLNQNE